MRTLAFLTLCSALAAGAQPDWRNIRSGSEIPTQTYADQPYVVKTGDGAWLVCVTTGAGREGEPGQHVVTRRSTDQGRTWSAAVEVEPAGGPEASYAVMLKTPSGRVFIFYNHNTDNVRQVIADNPPYKDGYCRRVDSLGHFVFKYSDDDGRSWSAKRYEIPQRDFEIDRRNPYGGKLKFFWNVGKAFAHRGAGYVPLHKVGGFGEGFFTSNEGVLLRSDNILTERDPEKIRWETLPEGEIGIRTPPGGGPIAAEHSFSELSDGSLFCVYRTIDGHPAFSYSRNSGRAWATPRYMRYDDGRLMKHPRAANFAWRCENGKYLYWFHNHGGRFIRDHPRRRTIAYQDRNPVWLSGGVEADSPQGRVIRWSQPEIVLYDDDPAVRMSYPDLVEENGKYFLTETQKEIARVHEIDPSLLKGLWGQLEAKTVAREGLVLDLEGESPGPPQFVQPSARAGFSIDLQLRFESLAPGQVLLDNRTPAGQGFALQTTARGTVELVINDGRTENRWDTDPGALETGKPQHLTAIVDGGPNIITFVVNGRLCDGGDSRQFGWGRFSPHLRSANGDARSLRMAPKLDGQLLRLRIYNRALRTSEAVGNHRAGASPRAPAAENWPQWRGPHSQGVSSETGLPVRWSAQKNLAWKAPLAGAGVSSPVVWGERVFVTSQTGRAHGARGSFPLLARDDSTLAEREHPIQGARAGSGDVFLVVEAFGRSDGRRLWEYRVKATGELPDLHEKHNLASPTPLVDGERIYAWFGNGQLVALDLEGRLVWSRHLGQEISPFRNPWGHGSSPALHGDSLILLCDHRPRSYLLALDRRTGKQLWMADRGQGRTSHSTPLIVRGPNGDELLINSSERIDAYDPAGGKLLWHAGSERQTPIPTAVFHDGIIYLSRGYRNSDYLALRPGGKGDVTASHVLWRASGGASYVPSIVFHDGLLYITNEIGVVTCADARTGATVWRRRLGGVFFASPVAGDGKIYMVSETGTTFVLRAGREPEVLAENDLGERLLASPAISGGRLYLRSDATLFAVQ